MGKSIKELLVIYSARWGKGAKFTRCPPGEGEERDPGWEKHKPRERAGFRELDEYSGEGDEDGE